MKSTTRIAAGAIAFALALLIAPATFAADGAQSTQSSKETAAPCSCMTKRPHGAQAEKQPAPSSAPEAPVFTDQG